MMLKNIIIYILILILIIFYYNKKYLQKENININVNIDIVKYPYIHKFKDILHIYSKLFFLTQFNRISFHESLFYMNKFLELIFNFIGNNKILNINNYIQKYLDYMNISLNSIQSIIINIPVEYDIENNNKIVNESITNLTDTLVNELHNLTISYKYFIISRLNSDNLKNINIHSNFIYDMKENMTNTIDYSQHFNLY